MAEYFVQGNWIGKKVGNPPWPMRQAPSGSVRYYQTEDEAADACRIFNNRCVSENIWYTVERKPMTDDEKISKAVDMAFAPLFTKLEEADQAWARAHAYAQGLLLAEQILERYRNPPEEDKS